MRNKKLASELFETITQYDWDIADASLRRELVKEIEKALDEKDKGFDAAREVAYQLGGCTYEMVDSKISEYLKEKGE